MNTNTVDLLKVILTNQMHIMDGLAISLTNAMGDTRMKYYQTLSEASDNTQALLKEVFCEKPN